MRTLRYPLFLLAGLLGPWILSLLPFPVRVAGIFLGALAAALLAAAAARLSRHRRLLLFGAAWACSVTLSAFWIAIASFSAQVSILTPLPLYLLAGTGAVLPLLLFLRLGAGTATGGTGRTATLVLAVLFLGSVLLAAPGRRYEGGEETPEIRQVASSLADVREALSWVHEHVTWERAPFTDRAGDTLSRGEATCGGMSNLLDKILKAMKIPSRIVHLEQGKRIHTLVEYRKDPPGRWVLADPQENLLGDDYGGISGYEAVFGKPGGDLPKRWKGHADLFIYRQGRGYRRVGESNAREFYPEP